MLLSQRPRLAFGVAARLRAATSKTYFTSFQ